MQSKLKDLLDFDLWERDMQPWISEALTSEQQKPFTRTTRNACILAAAGSGKTRTLTHLLMEDLANGIRPDGPRVAGYYGDLHAPLGGGYGRGGGDTRGGVMCSIKLYC